MRDDKNLRWLIGALFAVLMFALQTTIASFNTQLAKLHDDVAAADKRDATMAEIMRSMDRRLEFLEQARNIPR